MRPHVLILPLVMAVTACGPAAAPVQAPEQGDAPPQRGGYLAQMLPYSVQNLDPHTTENYISYGFVSRYWFEGLTTIDYRSGEDWRIENQAVPLLAESWNLETPTTYTFSIRRGVRFHNGDPLTADDVVFSLRRIADPATKATPQVFSSIQNVESVEKLDDFLVALKTRAPQPDLVINLAQSNISILSKKYVESGADVSKSPIGTGPFKSIAYKQDVESLALRNESYWQDGRPYLDGIRSVLKVEDSTITAAMIAGKVDLTVAGDVAQFQALTATNPALKSRRYTVNSLSGIYSNLNRPPLNDERVRRAIHLALDRQEMDQVMNFGDGVQTGPLIQAGKTGWTIPDDELAKMPGYRQPKDQDIAEAKRLLVEAGFPQGFRTTLTHSADTVASQRGSQAAQAQLRKSLNVALDLVPLDSASINKRETSGDFDLLLNSAGYVDSPLLRGIPYFHSTGVYARNAGINDPEVDRLMNAWRAEFDRSKQASYAVQLQRVMLDRLYHIPMPQLTLYQVWQPWVHDWVGNFGARPEIRNARDVWLDLDQAPSDRKQRN